MTIDGWKGVIHQANNNPEQFELLAKLLVEQDEAKQILRDKNYGCTGMSLLETVKLIPEQKWNEE